jgi:hypothetical protein
MRTEKQYDFTSMNDFFNQFESPRQLADELVQLLFNYASCVDEDSVDLFRNDVSTIYLIHSELLKVE